MVNFMDLWYVSSFSSLIHSITTHWSLVVFLIVGDIVLELFFFSKNRMIYFLFRTWLTEPGAIPKIPTTENVTFLPPTACFPLLLLLKFSREENVESYEFHQK